jgi:hypothetical protein
MLLTLYLYEYPSSLVPVILPAYTTYEDGTDRVFRKSEHKIQKPRNRPKERIQHSEHDECLKSSIRIKNVVNLLVIRFKYLQNARYAQVKIKCKLFGILSRLCPVPYTGFLFSQYI